MGKASHDQKISSNHRNNILGHTHAAHTWCVPVLKGHQWHYGLVWQWQYLVTSPWPGRHHTRRGEQQLSLPLKVTHRVAELNNQLVEMTDPVIHTDSCVPKIHLILQNCHYYFLFLQSYLEISQICEQNYLHSFFSDSSNFPLNRYVPVNDMGVSQSKQITSLGVMGFKKLVVKNTSTPLALQKAWNAQVLAGWKLL